MGDALPGKTVEGGMQRDRVRGRQRPVVGAARGHDANRAEGGRLMAERRPDLTQKGSHRGLAAGAGHGDDRVRLTREEACSRPGQRDPHVVDAHQGSLTRLDLPFRHDRDRAVVDRLPDEGGSVRPDAGNREKDEARLHRPAVGGQPRHGTRGVLFGEALDAGQELAKRHRRMLSMPMPRRATSGKGVCGITGLGGMSSSGATRAMIFPHTSPEFQAAVWKP